MPNNQVNGAGITNLKTNKNNSIFEIISKSTEL